MKLHHLRNATCVIESGSTHILIDPMLSPKGALPSFAYFRHRSVRNPTVPLPQGADQILDRVTHCLVTHSQKWGIDLLTHTDHIDPTGQSFLKNNQIPVICPRKDAGFMKKKGIPVEAELDYWKPHPLFGGEITAIPAQHGHGWTRHFMANGAGFFIALPDEPTLYICGDTVYTDEVDRALTQLKPDICVIPAGSASLDVGGPILMSLEEIITFIRNAPGKVIANHLEALNHCPTTRLQLKAQLEKRGLLSKTIIPEDGQTIALS